MKNSKQVLLVILALCLFAWIGKIMAPQIKLFIKGHISRLHFDPNKEIPDGYAPEVVGPVNGEE